MKKVWNRLSWMILTRDTIVYGIGLGVQIRTEIPIFCNKVKGPVNYIKQVNRVVHQFYIKIDNDIS